MPIKLSGKGNLGELKSFFNALSAHPDCLSITSQPYHMHKDLTDATQTFEITMRPAKEYKRVSKPRDTYGQVYLVETPYEGVYKIGQSTDVKDRKATFGVKLPFDVKTIHIITCSNRFAVESALKKRYAKKAVRLNGSEFYKLSERDVEDICRM